MRRVVGGQNNRREDEPSIPRNNFDEESKGPQEYREKGIVNGKIQYVTKKQKDPYDNIKSKNDGIKGYKDHPDYQYQELAGDGQSQQFNKVGHANEKEFKTVWTSKGAVKVEAEKDKLYTSAANQESGSRGGSG